MTDLMQSALDLLEQAQRHRIRTLTSRAPEISEIQRTLAAAVAAGADLNIIRVDAGECGGGDLFILATTPSATYATTADALHAAGLAPMGAGSIWWKHPARGWLLALHFTPAAVRMVATQQPEQVAA